MYGQDVINELIEELHASVGETCEPGHASSSRWCMRAAAAGGGCLGVHLVLARGLPHACHWLWLSLPPTEALTLPPARLGAEMSAGFEGEMRSLVDYAR